MATSYVLLDRDGTLNVERHYLAHPDGLELFPEVIPALRLLREAGLGCVVITNQSGIARGYLDEPTLQRIHDRLIRILEDGRVSLEGIYHCPHGPAENCRCRKPLPGLAQAAARDLGFDLGQAFVVGDKRADIELGIAVGARTVLVRTGYGEQTLHEGPVPADYIALNLLDAAQWICTRVKPALTADPASGDQITQQGNQPH